MRDHGLRAVICISFRKGISTTMKQMTKTDQLFTPLILLFSSLQVNKDLLTS